mmetsp:Transcript_25544/g.55833  ORF Transcript_25544/g.55833 Transcript_25544/m.55833 type:complete len:455 (+) Transcript_25544:101-1465(+)
MNIIYEEEEEEKSSRTTGTALFDPERGTYGSVGNDDEDEPENFFHRAKEISLIGKPNSSRHPRKSLLTSFLGTNQLVSRRSLVNPLQCSFEELDERATLEDIDASIDLIATDVVGANVIRPVKPNRTWLWRQWRGTVLVSGVWNACITVTISVILSIVLPRIGKGSTDLHPFVIEALSAFNVLWKYMLTLSTFILTFFLSQCYALWRNVYNLCRSVQGRTNDFGLLCATHAARDAKGEYTPEARRLLLDIAMAVRLYHAFAYATKARRFRILHTPRALMRMVERGIMTKEMHDAIRKLDISTANRSYAMLEWIMIRWTKGLRDGTLQGGPGLEQTLLEKACMLRSQYGTFGDVLDARIPLAYAHIVQVMVDTLLLCSPFALYSDMGCLCIFASAVLTVFFVGLLDLSKVMLDPLDNEDYLDHMIEMNVGVFIRESNGGSTRFWKGAEYLPQNWV